MFEEYGWQAIYRAAVLETDSEKLKLRFGKLRMPCGDDWKISGHFLTRNRRI
jgi:hypothetical protein